MTLWDSLPIFVYITCNSSFQVDLRDLLTENYITIQLNIWDSFFYIPMESEVPFRRDIGTPDQTFLTG